MFSYEKETDNEPEFPFSIALYLPKKRRHSAGLLSIYFIFHKRTNLSVII
ncbi:MAG: hypothetical protein LWX56_10405 [Ignavibacteria bacterium]|nr:hypothetical protein [Ignavibacteria bacterium]